MSSFQPTCAARAGLAAEAPVVHRAVRPARPGRGATAKVGAANPVGRHLDLPERDTVHRKLSAGAGRTRRESRAGRRRERIT